MSLNVLVNKYLVMDSRESSVIIFTAICIIFMYVCQIQSLNMKHITRQEELIVENFQIWKLM